MANILGIFTAIILAVAAFVAMKNKARLEDEISTRKTEEASLAQSQDKLKAAQAVLKALPIERAGVDEQFAAKSAEEAKLQEANAKMKAEIEDKTATIAANKTTLDGIREKIAKVGEINTLADKMKAMRTELEELAQTITDNEASLANLTAQNTAAQADADRRNTEFKILSNGESLPALKTSIRSIYPTWGFVTLNDGNNAGVNANSTLDVVRDGAVVARLLVTAVESRSASASIIPDSIAQDVTLMVGDRVVPSSKDKKAVAN
jgi:archaellum component FlaG (FlaF/FlaG flagellin family)